MGTAGPELASCQFLCQIKPFPRGKGLDTSCRAATESCGTSPRYLPGDPPALACLFKTLLPDTKGSSRAATRYAAAGLARLGSVRSGAAPAPPHRDGCGSKCASLFPAALSRVAPAPPESTQGCGAGGSRWCPITWDLPHVRRGERRKRGLLCPVGWGRRQRDPQAEGRTLGLRG